MPVAEVERRVPGEHVQVPLAGHVGDPGTLGGGDHHRQRVVVVRAPPVVQVQERLRIVLGRDPGGRDGHDGVPFSCARRRPGRGYRGLRRHRQGERPAYDRGVADAALKQVIGRRLPRSPAVGAGAASADPTRAGLLCQGEPWPSRTSPRATGAKSGRGEQSPSQAFAVPAGAVDVTGIDPAATPIGPQSKSDAAQAHARAGAAAGRTAGAALRAEHRRAPAQRAADPAGHGHRREGRGDRQRARHGRSGRRAFRDLQETDPGGIGARFPVADREAGSRTRIHRGFQPVAVRGRAGRPGPRTGARKRVVEAVCGDQRLREEADRKGCHRRQMLPAHLERGAEGAAAGPAGGSDEVLEIQSR